MILTEKEVRQLITQEITWCIEHPDATLSSDYQEGFRAGLKQAMSLIDKIEKQLIEDVAQGILEEQKKYGKDNSHH